MRSFPRKCERMSRIGRNRGGTHGVKIRGSYLNGWTSSTCHTFSLACSKGENRMLTPKRPPPPHMLLGTRVSSAVSKSKGWRHASVSD